MIAQDRLALVNVLAELRRHYPEWRFGQLMSNVAGWADVDVWDMEDDQLLAAAKAHLEQLSDHDQERKGSLYT
jgi:hypothetical protein